MQLEKQANILAEESLSISSFFPVTSVGSSFIVMKGKKHF